ncbi:hypothetical protein ACM5Q9_02815 [Advenella sp. RU8]|uniref:hypothetical protein n=1 Tax=Advenella sp. RU8 TaxID=3399575 RepID=UPI003AAD1D60
MKMVYAALFTGIFLSACTTSSSPDALQPTEINNSSGKTPVKAANCIHENWKSIYPAAKIQRQTVDYYLITIPGPDADIAQAQIEPGAMFTAQVKLLARPDANPQITQMVKDCL